MKDTNTNITSDAYKDMFASKNASNGFIGGVVILVLFSILSGLFGYLLGDSRAFDRLSWGSSSVKGEQLSEYSNEELQDIVDYGEYDFEMYYQIVANLKDKYVDPEKIQDEKLFEGTLKGMVDSIGDRATTYFTREEYQDYLESLSGTFSGIGVRLEYQNNFVQVIEVLPNSPAEQEGVQTGYIFSKVDGEDVSRDSIEEIVTKVKGEAGTEVTIVFVDAETGEEVEKKITRGDIEVESMRLIEKDSETVVFEVSRFTEKTLDLWTSKWDDNVQEILRKGYKNVILDLRGNGGGYLDAAIYAANDFLEPGKLIVSERSRIDQDQDTLSNKSNPLLKDKNVVILVNGGTASASEILAGAITHHNGYKTIGSKTFGKGTVQKTYDLSDGGALKITVEYWLLPDGKRLDNENPIVPKEEVKYDAELAKEGRDNVLEEAMGEFEN